MSEIGKVWKVAKEQLIHQQDLKKVRLPAPLVTDVLGLFVAQREERRAAHIEKIKADGESFKKMKQEQQQQQQQQQMVNN